MNIDIENVNNDIYIFSFFPFSKKSLKFQMCDRHSSRISHRLLSHQCIVQVIVNVDVNECSVDYGRTKCTRLSDLSTSKERFAEILSKNAPINIYASYVYVNTRLRTL